MEDTGPHARLMPSTSATALAALAVAGTLVGVGVTSSGPAAAPPDAPATRPVSADTTRDTVPIECGGYDADGHVVNERATRIDRVPADPAGMPRIPAVCGGYTADGTFIGDD